VQKDTKKPYGETFNRNELEQEELVSFKDDAQRQILNPLRLPIPPRPQRDWLYPGAGRGVK